MSSSRSVAAARQRRAGTADAPPTQRGPGTSISSSQVLSQSKPKTLEPPMTINKAITLTTLRLSRIETIVQNMIDRGQTTDENDRIVGDDVMTMIMSRLDTIEKNQSTFQEQLQDIETRIEESSEIIMNLQTFTMDTNQTLVKKQIADCIEKSKVALESKISKSNLSILKLQSSIMELTQKLSLVTLSGEASDTITPVDVIDTIDTVDITVTLETDTVVQPVILEVDQPAIKESIIKLSKEDLDDLNYIV